MWSFIIDFGQRETDYINQMKTISKLYRNKTDKFIDWFWFLRLGLSEVIKGKVKSGKVRLG